MAIPITRYSDILQYNAETGKLSVFQRKPPWQRVSLEHMLATVADLAALDAQAGVFAAGYSLAQTAHEWRGRPTDSQRGALIQAAQQLRSLGLADPANILGLALEQADAALLAGGDAASEIVALLGEQIRRAERAADRCGRRAAQLLDPGDRVLLYGFGGPPLLALLHALPALDPLPTLFVAGNGDGPQLLVDLATAAGFPASRVDDGAWATNLPGLAVVTATALGADGGAVCPTGSGALIVAMRQRGIPCYLLAASGPIDEQTAALDLQLGSGDIVLADLISAIITDRGIYRPAMIGRYHGDADTPLDVIPLT